MPYGIVHHFPGGTKENYETSLAAVHPNEGKDLPEGQIFHAEGPSAGGLDHHGRARVEGKEGTLPRWHPHAETASRCSRRFPHASRGDRHRRIQADAISSAPNAR